MRDTLLLPRGGPDLAPSGAGRPRCQDVAAWLKLISDYGSPQYPRGGRVPETESDDGEPTRKGSWSAYVKAIHELELRVPSQLEPNLRDGRTRDPTAMDALVVVVVREVESLSREILVWESDARRPAGRAFLFPLFGQRHPVPGTPSDEHGYESPALAQALTGMALDDGNSQKRAVQGAPRVSREVRMFSIEWTVTYVRLNFDRVAAVGLIDLDEVVEYGDKFAWRSPNGFSQEERKVMQQGGLAGDALLWLLEEEQGRVFLDSGKVPAAAKCVSVVKSPISLALTVPAAAALSSAPPLGLASAQAWVRPRCHLPTRRGYHRPRCWSRRHRSP